jgi:transposase InsO family protein
LIIRMQEPEKLSLEEIRAFLAGTGPVEFTAEGRAGRYGWVEQTLQQHDYVRLGRADKGLLREFIAKMTGMSRAQGTRLIGQYRKQGAVPAPVYQRRKFTSRYTETDIRLLAYVDQAHGVLSGPATRRILEREHREFGQALYERLASISVAQIYRLRATAVYRKHNTAYRLTRPTPVNIGERRKPAPGGSPGYLRLDTVHQGDQDGVKGLYHLNAVDEVTQWEIVGAVPFISEQWLVPLLEAMLEQFPFRIRGFHSDNGSEFINHTVERLLNKLLIEQTKSRPHHSNDNGLVESKNGAVIRKHIGFGHIASHHAEAVNEFHRQHLNPYLNFHRPCGVPELRTQPNGKTRRVYPRYRTPLEILAELPQAEQFLSQGVTLEQLKQQATKQSDTDAARDMQIAKKLLFRRIRARSA